MAGGSEETQGAFLRNRDCWGFELNCDWMIRLDESQFNLQRLSNVCMIIELTYEIDEELIVSRNTVSTTDMKSVVSSRRRREMFIEASSL